MPTTDPPLTDHSYHSPGSVFLALGHDFGTQNLASPALFTTSPNPGHGLCQFFLLPISTTYAPGPFLTPNPCRILVRGSNTQTRERKFSVPATADPRAVMQNPYASQFRRLTHQPGHGYRALLSCQTVAHARNSSGSARLGLCLAPSCGSFCRLAGKRETTMADGHGSRLDSKPIVRRPT